MRKLDVLGMVALVALASAGCAGVAWEVSLAPGVQPDVDVTVFYDALAPYGHWMSVSPLGWVWSPRGVAADWRPYTEGRWIATDLGWTWVSDWPWGWAPFHYGRWTYRPDLGWLWVPGRVWAPAWVSWRWGDGWVGWAPLPPEAEWDMSLGLVFDGLEPRLAQAPTLWSFVEWGHLTDPRLRHHIAPHGRNRDLIPRTRDVTRYEPGAWPAERGLRPEELEDRLGVAVPRYRLRDLPAPPDRRARRPRGDEAGVYRPRVEPAPEGRTPRQTRPPRKPPESRSDHGEAPPRTDE